MTIQDDAQIKAVAQTTSAMETKVAIYLKKSWGLVVLAAQQMSPAKMLPKDPTEGIQFPADADDEAKLRLRDAQWLGMARDLIGKREISVEGQTVSIAELDKVMGAEAKASLGVESLEQLIPTTVQVEAVAQTVGKGVARSVGTGVEFFDGLFGGASLGDVFMGLLSWIFGGFKQGLMESIAQQTGERMGANVKDELVKLRDASTTIEGQDLSGILKPEVIQAVAVEVAKVPAQTVRKDAVIDPLLEIRAVPMGGIDAEIRGMAQGELRTQFFNGIGEGFKKNFAHLYTGEQDGLWSRVRSAVRLPTEQKVHRDALDAIQLAVSERLAKVIVDETYVYDGDDVNLKGKHLRDMKVETRAEVLAKEASKVILELKGKQPESAQGIYALVDTQLPEQIRAGIVASEKDVHSRKIPWGISGDEKGLEKMLVGAEKPLLVTDLSVEKQAAMGLAQVLLSPKLKAQLSDKGQATEVGLKLAKLAGAELGDGHISAIAEAIAPVVLRTKADLSREEFSQNPDGMLEKVSGSFSKALQDNAGNINDASGGVQLSPQALAVVADHMALAYFDSELKTTSVPVAFSHAMAAREDAAVVEKIRGTLAPLVEGNVVELNGLVDPANKAGLNDVQVKQITLSMAKGLKEFAVNEVVLKDVDKTEGYAAAHEAISAAMGYELAKSEPKLPIGLKGLVVIADMAAVEFIRAGSGAEPTEAVKELMAAQRQGAVADVVRKAIVLQGMESQGLMTAANDGVAVKMDVAADALKTMIAQKVLATEKFSTLNKNGYEAFADEVRGVLAEQRVNLGVSDSAQGSALLDVLAFKITTGVVDKVAGGALQVPTALEIRNTTAENVLAAKVIPQQIRELIIPKLTGVTSLDDATLDKTNVTIANVVALDASRTGRSVNAERVAKNIADVVLYYKGQIDSGKAVNVDELPRLMRGALAEHEAGLGPQAIEKLVPILTNKVTGFLDSKMTGVSGSDDSLSGLLPELKGRVASDVGKGLEKSTYASWLWSRKTRNQVANLSAEAVEKIMLGDVVFDSKRYSELDIAQQNSMLNTYVNRYILQRTSGLGSVWVGKVVQPLADTLASHESKVAHVHPLHPSYVRDNNRSVTDPKKRVSGDDSLLPWKREEIHNQMVQSVQAFELVRAELAEVRAKTEAKALATKAEKVTAPVVGASALSSAADVSGEGDLKPLPTDSNSKIAQSTAAR